MINCSVCQPPSSPVCPGAPRTVCCGGLSSSACLWEGYAEVGWLSPCVSVCSCVRTEGVSETSLVTEDCVWCMFMVWYAVCCNIWYKMSQLMLLLFYLKNEKDTQKELVPRLKMLLVRCRSAEHASSALFHCIRQPPPDLRMLIHCESRIYHPLSEGF